MDAINQRPRGWSRLGGWLAVGLGSLASLLVGFGLGAYRFATPPAKPGDLALGGDPNERRPLEGLRRAVAQYEVRAKPLALLDEKPASPHEFDTFRRTQAAYLRSPFVITTALRDPAVGQCDLLKSQDDPVSWVSENLIVYYPANSEILSVVLPHPTAAEADLRTIVNGVCKAYQDEVIFRSKTQRILPLQLLKAAANDLGDQILTLQRRTVAEGTDPAVDEAQTEGRAREIAGLLRMESKLQDRINRLQIEVEAPCPIRAIGGSATGAAVAEFYDPAEEAWPWLPL